MNCCWSKRSPRGPASVSATGPSSISTNTARAFSALIVLYLSGVAAVWLVVRVSILWKNVLMLSSKRACWEFYQTLSDELLARVNLVVTFACSSSASCQNWRPIWLPHWPTWIVISSRGILGNCLLILALSVTFAVVLTFHAPILLALLASFTSCGHAQVTLPRVTVNNPGCEAKGIQECRMNCPRQYHDETRYLCPCYSKLAQCLVRLGCTMKQKRDIFAFCTRKGYCKDGYCKFREGDLSPRGDIRPEVFELTSVKTPYVPCIDGCCPGDLSCAQNTSLIGVREPGRGYRKQEQYLPPRYGDPRLGVNQAYDRMPYSIPVQNLP